MPRSAGLLLLMLLAAAPLAAQPAVPPAPGGAVRAGGEPQAVFNGRLRQTTLRPPRLSAEVTIDGELGEAVWQQAALLTGFSQYAPVDRLPAEDSTEVLVWYSEHAIYFGIRAYESHGPVLATRADRDRIGGDDHVQLTLDTFLDRRRALVFAVNALGVQSDGVLTETGGSGSLDLNPDFIYESRGRLTPWGYEVEVRIPFKSLRYQPAAVQDWGINITRRVQHSGHEQTWTPAERGAASFLAQSGTLTGLSGMRRGLVLDINPVLTGRMDGAPRSPADRTWRYGRAEPDIGGNLRWGITSNLTANATVNPDFSQVEADVGQVVFDPRSALSFPEKRPFFLEGSEMFESPNTLVYTRRITSPVAAAKMTGKVGGLNVGMLSAVDDDAFSRSRNDHPVFNVLRLRRDLGAQSNLGFLYTDRMEGADYNRVAAVDTRLVIGGRYVLTGQLATSFTGIAGETEHGRPLFDVRLNRPGRDWGFNAVVSGRHPDFAAGTGFIARPGTAHANLTPRRTFFPANSRVEAVSTSLILDGTWEYDRFTRGTEPNDIKVNTSTSFSFRGGWRGTFFTFAESFRYPAYLYANYFLERRDPAGAVLDTVPYSGTDRLSNYGGMISVATPQFQKFSANAQIIGGHDDNFDEWSSAWVLFSTLNGDWRPTGKVRVNARYVQQRFHRVSDGSLVRLRAIPRLKLEYQASRSIFFRYVGQYDATKVDALRDDSRTEAPILIRNPATGTFRQSAAQQRGSFRSDWLFSYQPNPGTVVFAGYGTSLNGGEFFAPRELERSADGLFVKVSYLFRM